MHFQSLIHALAALMFAIEATEAYRLHPGMRRIGPLPQKQVQVQRSSSYRHRRPRHVLLPRNASPDGTIEDYIKYYPIDRDDGAIVTAGDEAALSGQATETLLINDIAGANMLAQVTPVQNQRADLGDETTQSESAPSTSPTQRTPVTSSSAAAVNSLSRAPITPTTSASSSSPRGPLTSATEISDSLVTSGLITRLPITTSSSTSHAGSWVMRPGMTIASRASTAVPAPAASEDPTGSASDDSDSESSDSQPTPTSNNSSSDDTDSSPTSSSSSADDGTEVLSAVSSSDADDDIEATPTNPLLSASAESTRVVTANSVVVVVANGTTGSSTTRIRSTSTHFVYVTAEPTSTPIIGAFGSGSGDRRCRTGMIAGIVLVVGMWML